VERWGFAIWAIWAKAHWLERCSANLWANINWWLHLSLSPLFLSNLFWRLSNKLIHLVAGCVMEGFHGVLPKEHPGAFYDVPWEYIKRCLLTIMVSQTCTTNIWNKKYQNWFFSTNIIIFLPGMKQTKNHMFSSCWEERATSFALWTSSASWLSTYVRRTGLID